MNVFMLTETKNGWFFELRSDSGKIIMTSNMYASKADAMNRIAEIKDSTRTSDSTDGTLHIAKAILNTYSEDFHNLAKR